MFPFKKLAKWQDNSKSVKILITGKTGTGKSALINSITGLEVSKEGHSLEPETEKVKYSLKEVGNVSLKVWDSPGLQDGKVGEDGTIAEAKYIRQITE